MLPGLCDSEIRHFLVARRAFVTCFRRVTIDLAGICKGKLEIVTCFVRHKKKTIKLFLTREARYDFEFPLQMPAKTIITRLQHVTIARRATVKCLAPFCSVSPAVAQCAFSIRNSILPTLLVVLLKPDCWRLGERF